MPNWCEGNIRFRGTRNSIIEFLKNEIVSCKFENGETVEEKPNIDFDGTCMIVSESGKHSWLYIRNTRRNFIDGPIEVWFPEEDGDKEIIVCIDRYKVAWSFSQNDAWKEIVKKYKFDVKMTGYEHGMLFSQIKTFLRNGREKEEIREYPSEEEWMWYCPEPNKGG